MSEDQDGITMMRARMTRARRVPPNARNPAADPAPLLTEVPAPSTPPAAARDDVPAPRAADPPAPVRTRPSPRQVHPAVGAGDRTANLAIRVRQPLDDHLADVVHAFRRDGVRTSKVELIEMLLWELPGDPAQVRGRLAAFRAAAPRTTPLGD